MESEPFWWRPARALAGFWRVHCQVRSLSTHAVSVAHSFSGFLTSEICPAENTLVRAAGAAAFGAGSVAAVVSLSATREKYVGKALYNSLVGAPDPMAILPAAVRCL